MFGFRDGVGPVDTPSTLYSIKDYPLPLSPTQYSKFIGLGDLQIIVKYLPIEF